MSLALCAWVMSEGLDLAFDLNPQLPPMAFDICQSVDEFGRLALLDASSEQIPPTYPIDIQRHRMRGKGEQR
jgi:hypothetical protein